MILQINLMTKAMIVTVRIIKAKTHRRIKIQTIISRNLKKIRKYRILYFKEKLRPFKKQLNSNNLHHHQKEACFKDLKIYFQNPINLIRVLVYLENKFNKLKLCIPRIKINSYLYLKMRKLFNKIQIWIINLCKLENLMNLEKYLYHKVRNYRRISQIKFQIWN